MFDFLSEAPMLAIFSASLLLVLGCGALGSAVARRSGMRTDRTATLEAATYGLLALLLGFTFSMAITRADQRRAAITDEVNAIGTTALRARMLPAPHDGVAQTQLLAYTRVRTDLLGSADQWAELAAAIEASNAIQEALWQDAMALVAADSSVVPVGLYIQALNEMFDSQGRRLSVATHHIPLSVVMLLYLVAMLACAFSGYTSGKSSGVGRVSLYLTGFVVCLVMAQILDIDRSARDFVRPGNRSMVDLERTLDQRS